VSIASHAKTAATHLATLGPVGRKMPAPGTWGSAAGLFFYILVLAPLNLRDWRIFLLAVIALNTAAVVICHTAEHRIGKKDPPEVIFDEFAALPLVFLGAETFIRQTARGSDYAFAWALLGFLLFRVFDILKPFGIRKLQALRGGLGIVADDIAAALAACAALHVLRFIAVHFAK